MRGLMISNLRDDGNSETVRNLQFVLETWKTFPLSEKLIIPIRKRKINVRSLKNYNPLDLTNFLLNLSKALFWRGSPFILIPTTCSQ